MKIVLTNVSTHAIGHCLEQVIDSVLSKTDGGDAVIGYTVTADVVVNLDIKGSGEPQHLFTDRTIMGKPEIFTVVPQFDPFSNLMPNMETNQESTFEALGEALSRELPKERIVSEYKDADLTYVSHEVGGDLSEVHYDHKDGFKVLKYVRDGVGLVAEMVLLPKEEDEPIA